MIHFRPFRFKPSYKIYLGYFDCQGQSVEKNKLSFGIMAQYQDLIAEQTKQCAKEYSNCVADSSVSNIKHG